MGWGWPSFRFLEGQRSEHRTLGCSCLRASVALPVHGWLLPGMLNECARPCSPRRQRGSARLCLGPVAWVVGAFSGSCTESSLEVSGHVSSEWVLHSPTGEMWLGSLSWWETENSQDSLRAWISPFTGSTGCEPTKSHFSWTIPLPPFPGCQPANLGSELKMIFVARSSHGWPWGARSPPP